MHSCITHADSIMTRAHFTLVYFPWHQHFAIPWKIIYAEEYHVAETSPYYSHYTILQALLWHELTLTYILPNDGHEGVVSILDQLRAFLPDDGAV